MKKLITAALIFIVSNMANAGYILQANPPTVKWRDNTFAIGATVVVHPYEERIDFEEFIIGVYFRTKSNEWYMLDYGVFEAVNNRDSEVLKAVKDSDGINKFMDAQITKINQTLKRFKLRVELKSNQKYAEPETDFEAKVLIRSIINSLVFKGQ